MNDTCIIDLTLKFNMVYNKNKLIYVELFSTLK